MFGFGRPAAVEAATAIPMDVENKDVGTNVDDRSDSVRIVHAQEENNLSRALSQRHIQMIALAGAIVRLFVILYS